MKSPVQLLPLLSRTGPLSVRRGNRNRVSRRNAGTRGFETVSVLLLSAPLRPGGSRLAVAAEGREAISAAWREGSFLKVAGKDQIGVSAPKLRVDDRKSCLWKCHSGLAPLAFVNRSPRLQKGRREEAVQGSRSTAVLFGRIGTGNAWSRRGVFWRLAWPEREETGHPRKEDPFDSFAFRGVFPKESVYGPLSQGFRPMNRPRRPGAEMVGCNTPRSRT